MNYYLVGGRAFFAQQEIYDLVNLLRTLENPLDALQPGGTLRSPFGCLSDETLFILSRCRAACGRRLADPATLAQLPHGQAEATRRAGENLRHWRSLKDRLPIARLIPAVLAESGYDAAVRMEFLGDRKLANLWKLIDLARTFDRLQGLFGLAEFIGWLGDLVAAQPRENEQAARPENADVIRLMTIHQAKGLEFPVVVVPDLAADRGGPHPRRPRRWAPALRGAPAGRRRSAADPRVRLAAAADHRRTRGMAGGTGALSMSPVPGRVTTWCCRALPEDYAAGSARGCSPWRDSSTSPPACVSTRRASTGQAAAGAGDS
ncbi:MAG: 3'-5' exonuclease [Gemmataceae bacterium]